MHVRSTTQFATLITLGGSLAAAGGALFVSPAVAAGTPLTTTTCKTVAACLFGANAAKGYGVEGTSASNTGVVGTTTMKATSASTGKAGVSGYDSSTNKNGYNSGVYGTSPYAYGVQGKSAHGIGVFGTGGLGGVYGAGYDGVSAYSKNDGGAAMFAESDGGADEFNGEQGYDGSSDTYGDGVVASTTYGAALNGSSARGIPLYLNVTDEGDTIIDAQAHGGDEMVVDASGNMYLAGTLTQNDASRYATKRADGKAELTYGPREAEPTLEDSGEAALVNGVARVALDPSFAATIDERRSYLVFVTPEGENDGVYVTLKDASGFTIRESHGARTSLAVQYRIVAAPLGMQKPRLARITSSFPTSASFLSEKRGIAIRQASRLRAHSARAARAARPV